MDIKEMMGREVRRQGMENVLLCIRMCSEADIDRLGSEVVAGIYSDRCEGDDRRSALMRLGVVGQAYTELRSFRDGLAEREDMVPEVSALDVILGLLLAEGERMGRELGGDDPGAEMEEVRRRAGRTVCDICTLAFVHCMACDAMECMEAIE